ncbi:MAG: agmatinase [Flavobacteriaceae bacterium]|nr:agmatinase [Flavobacteriaceae bacterium]
MAKKKTTYLNSKDNFLALEDPKFYSYETCKTVIQQVPYEYTSSYLSGSHKGPGAMVKASQFVEFYDEELDQETYLKIGGICSMKPLDFKGKTDKKAIDYIEKETRKLLEDGKFVVSFGAEHTVTLGFVKAHLTKYPDLCVLQLDAHSDLRQSYHGNKYSHASVMARVHDLNVPLTQIGIRAQCIEEAQLIKDSANIHTFYAHQVRRNKNWAKEAIATLGENVYLTIDADGFDPSIVPAVGTAEPNGLLWNETIEFLREVMKQKNVIGFDIVEIAPRRGDILTEYTMAKLCFKLLGYLSLK